MQTTAQPQADRQERQGGTLTISGRNKEFGIRACSQRDPDYFQSRSGGNSAGVLPFGGRPRIFFACLSHGSLIIHPRASSLASFAGREAPGPRSPGCRSIRPQGLGFQPGAPCGGPGAWDLSMRVAQAAPRCRDRWVHQGKQGAPAAPRPASRDPSPPPRVP